MATYACVLYSLCFCVTGLFRLFSVFPLVPLIFSPIVVNIKDIFQPNAFRIIKSSNQEKKKPFILLQPSWSPSEVLAESPEVSVALSCCDPYRQSSACLVYYSFPNVLLSHLLSTRRCFKRLVCTWRSF